MKKPKKEAYLDFINSLSKKEKPIDPHKISLIVNQ